MYQVTYLPRKDRGPTAIEAAVLLTYMRRTGLEKCANSYLSLN